MAIKVSTNSQELDEVMGIARRLGATIQWPETFEDGSRSIHIFMPPTKAQLQSGRESDNGIFQDLVSAKQFMVSWETIESLRHDVHKKEIKAYVKGKLSTNDEWAKKALLLIMTKQLPEEQRSDRTVFDNGMGFTGVDAPILTSFAKQLRDRKFLSLKQMTILKKMIAKYWQQVIDASDEVKLLMQVKATRTVVQTRLPL